MTDWKQEAKKKGEDFFDRESLRLSIKGGLERAYGSFLLFDNASRKNKQAIDIALGVAEQEIKKIKEDNLSMESEMSYQKREFEIRIAELEKENKKLTEKLMTIIENGN